MPLQTARYFRIAIMLYDIMKFKRDFVVLFLAFVVSRLNLAFSEDSDFGRAEAALAFSMPGM